MKNRETGEEQVAQAEQAKKPSILQRLKGIFRKEGGETNAEELTGAIESGEVTIGDVAESAENAVDEQATETTEELQGQIGSIEKETPKDPILEKLKGLVAEEDKISEEAKNEIITSTETAEKKYASLKEALAELIPNSEVMDKELAEKWRKDNRIPLYDFKGGEINISSDEISLKFVNKEGGISQIKINPAEVEGLRDMGEYGIEQKIRAFGFQKYNGEKSLNGALYKLESQKEDIRKQNRWDEFSKESTTEEQAEGEQFKDLNAYLMATEKKQIVPPDKVKSCAIKRNVMPGDIKEKTGSLTEEAPGIYKLQYVDNGGGISELVIDSSKIQGSDNMIAQKMAGELRNTLGLKLPDGTTHPNDKNIGSIVAEETYRQDKKVKEQDNEQLF
ncbi:hypothetical protein KJ785_02585 [Patescibacteria group bacterium]|nr:hypothetical protein [Patescibacteria group bacterium]